MDTACSSERQCSTASERRRIRDEYSIIPVTEEAFPESPTDISLLWSFKTHVTADIWNGDVF